MRADTETDRHTDMLIAILLPLSGWSRYYCHIWTI